MEEPKPVIRIAAALIENGNGLLYLVRKTGTEYFMQAGGKIEAGETATEALIRELAEEIGLVVEQSDLKYLGKFSAPAANEADHIVEAQLFQITTEANLSPTAEIAEGRWVSLGDTGNLSLAPLTKDIVFKIAEKIG